MHAGIVVYTGAVLHTADVARWHKTDAVLHAAAVVYVGGVVYTGAVVHAGSVVYTGVVVQIAIYMLAPVLRHSWAFPYGAGAKRDVIDWECLGV
eukprot:4305658-Pyramimonas_sp.AAC.1